MSFNMFKATKCKWTRNFYLIFKGSTRGVIGADHVLLLGLCCFFLHFGLENYTHAFVLSADFSNFIWNKHFWIQIRSDKMLGLSGLKLLAKVISRCRHTDRQNMDRSRGEEWGRDCPSDLFWYGSPSRSNWIRRVQLFPEGDQYALCEIR